MDTIRLGLISDTHFPTKMPLLPVSAIESAFRNVDGILHAGDIETPDVLDYLSGIAPTQAVRGEEDTDLDLPEKRVLTFGNVRVGLTHGHRHPLVEGYFRLQRQLGNPYAGGRHLLDTLPERFEPDEVDVIVFGHLHTPLALERGGLLLVNPGAVYSISKEDAQWQLTREQDPGRRDMLENHIRRSSDKPYWQAPRSTIGILEIRSDGKVNTAIHPLPLLAYA